jgi:uncharacterized protein (TIGR02246 family)
MKIRHLVALVGLAIGYVEPDFAQQKDTADSQFAEEVRALVAKYDDAFNRNDADAVTTLYTGDAVFETPNGTFTGRENIEGLYRKIYFERNHSKEHVTTVGGLVKLVMRYVRPERGVIVLKKSELYAPMAPTCGS